MKTRSFYIITTLLCLVILLLAREVVKYEPYIYKYRFYNNLKQKGWFDKKLPLTELSADSTTMIMLTMGQSNAANSNNTLYIPHNQTKVLCYNKGNLFYGKDPLIGDQGTGGSVWPRLADMLIDSGLYKKVIIVPIAVGSTTINDWSTGFCYQRLKETLADLQTHHIKLTHIFWHQGEANNGSPKDEYKKQLAIILNTIRQHQPNAPFYVCTASYDPDAVTKPLGVDTVIENAQREFVAQHPNVLYGPNTDTIIHAIDRFDSHHFSATGVKKYTRAWFKALKEHKE